MIDVIRTPPIAAYDEKLEIFANADTLQETVDAAIDKGISPAIVRWFSDPEYRATIIALMEAGQYSIAPPHIVLIPKPGTNEQRKVYCNEALDRVLCTQIGQTFQKMYGHLIHPSCVSYQKGIGVGQIVRRISQYLTHNLGLVGAKFDIHHYFDDISEEARDTALEELSTGSCIDSMVWDYLHDDTVIDEHGQIIRAYKGIAQGFALSPFLANYLLRDIDAGMSAFDVVYYRYSDDILILGPDFEKARAFLYASLTDKGLKINPRKVVPIDTNTPFTFLGFQIHGERITFSKDSLDRFKKKIRSHTKTRKGQPLKSKDVLKRAIHDINHELYYAYMQNDREFGWAEYMFGIVNVQEDIEMLDKYIKDHLRHSYTGKWNSYGNYSKVPNDMLKQCGYLSMVHLYKLYRIHKELYRNEVRMRLA